MMNIITGNRKDTLQQILAVYGNRIVVHNYLENDTLGAGQPLTVESAKGIFSFIRGSEFEERFCFKGIIPPNVLKFNAETPSVIWTTEASVKQLHFQEDLPINTGFYPVPRLLWKLKQSSLYVFAIGEEELNGATKLYQAPFLNVSADGSVCMGSSDFKSKSRYYDLNIQKAENGFFNSIFTHTNTDVLLKVNIVDAMNEMAEKKNKVFDNSLLVESGKTVKDII